MEEIPVNSKRKWEERDNGGSMMTKKPKSTFYGCDQTRLNDGERNIKESFAPKDLVKHVQSLINKLFNDIFSFLEIVSKEHNAHCIYALLNFIRDVFLV